MKKVSNADSHREADNIGRGDPAGLLRGSSPRNDSSLWFWVATGFVLLLIGWGILFTVARKANVESVPLAPKEVRP